MKEILLKYLSDHSKLPDNELVLLANSFREKHLSKNDFWIKQGKVSKDFAFVCDGIHRIYNETNGNEITFQFVFPLTFVASISGIAANMPSQWNMQAFTRCNLLVIDRDRHHELMIKYPEALNIFESQFLKAFSTLENKILTFLNLNAEQRFQKLFSEQPEIFNLVPLKHIASSLGITAETLSRLRKKQFS
jgi:CRP-like cAMP-binding protein